MIFMIVVWVLIVVGIVFLARALLRGPSGRHPGYWDNSYHASGGPGSSPGMRMGNPEALRFLEERYAKGEIGRDEFMQKKADLTGQPTGPTSQPSDQPPGS
jgi:uncharacterized membrane protein